MSDSKEIKKFPLGAVTVRRVECSQKSGLLHDVGLIRDLDFYLRLDELRIFLMSETQGELVVTDASEIVGSSCSLPSSIHLVETKVSSIGVFEMYGIWQGRSDVLVMHACGRPFLSVITPPELDEKIRKKIVEEVRKAVRFSEGRAL